MAIKVPRFEGPQDAQNQAQQRFLREARAAAAIRHPHVCPIYDVGEHNGVPFVVMALVEGQSLAEPLSKSRYEDCRQAAALIVQVADALEVIHEHGIIHRDLKPGNILLDKAGQAVLTDFGLARATQDAEHLTTDGSILGTPAYMAPEQASLELGPVTPRSDVYSLGVVLYQMVTGRTPFQGQALTIIYQVAQQAPPPPTQFRPDLDPAIAAILAKAMARQPPERYGSAREFREALQTWLMGPVKKPVRVRPWMLPAGIVAAAALISVLILVAAFVFVYQTREGTLVLEGFEPDMKVMVDDEEKAVIVESPKLGKVKLTPGKDHKVIIKQGDKELLTDDFTLTAGGEKLLHVGVKQPPLPTIALSPIPDSERFDWQPKELVGVFGTHRWKYWGPHGWWPALTFSADGKDLLVLPRMAAPGQPELLSIREAATGRERLRIDRPNLIGAAYSADGRLMATLAGIPNDWTLEVSDTLSKKQRLRVRGSSGLDFGYATRWMVFSPNGKQFALLTTEKVRIWDLSSADEGKPAAEGAGTKIPRLVAEGGRPGRLLPGRQVVRHGGTAGQGLGPGNGQDTFDARRPFRQRVCGDGGFQP